jgi:hypothetical protein
MTSKIGYMYDHKKIQSYMTPDAILYKAIFSRLDKSCMKNGVAEIFHYYLSRSRVIMRMRSESPLNCLMQRDKYCLGAPSC